MGKNKKWTPSRISIFKLEKELELTKNLNKEEKAEWKLKEQDLQHKIKSMSSKLEVLEEKVEGTGGLTSWK